MSSKYLSFAVACATVLAPSAIGAKPMHEDHAPVSAAQIAGALADPTRAADNRALDAGRMPEAMLAFAQLRRGEAVAASRVGSASAPAICAAETGA